jgi:hypothetical protein
MSTCLMAPRRARPTPRIAGTLWATTDPVVIDPHVRGSGHPAALRAADELGPRCRRSKTRWRASSHVQTAGSGRYSIQIFASTCAKPNGRYTGWASRVASSQRRSVWSSGVCDERLDQRGRDGGPARARLDEHVAQPGERRAIADHTCDADLPPAAIRAGDEAVRERTLDDLAPHAGRPVTLAEPGLHDVELHPREIDRDFVGHRDRYHGRASPRKRQRAARSWVRAARRSPSDTAENCAALRIAASILGARGAFSRGRVNIQPRFHGKAKQQHRPRG